MEQKVVLMASTDSMGYLLLKKYLLETKQITSEEFIESTIGEIESFVEILNGFCEQYRDASDIESVILPELRDGDYNLEGFIKWLNGNRLVTGYSEPIVHFYQNMVERLK